MAPPSAQLEMRPGIWSSFFSDLSPEDMVRTFALKGWRHLEMSSEHAEALLRRGNPATVGKAFSGYAQDHKVCFPQGHLWLECDIADPEQPGTIDDLKKWLDLFVAIGIHAAVIHPGGKALRASGAGQKTIHDLNVVALNSLARHVQNTPLLLCVENMWETPIETFFTLMDAMSSPQIAICLDTGHLHVSKGNPELFIRYAGPRLKALHIADNDGSKDQHLMPYGRGTIAWDAVMNALGECNYSGLLNLEIPGERQGPIEIRQMKLDYFQNVLTFMGRCIKT